MQDPPPPSSFLGWKKKNSVGGDQDKSFTFMCVKALYTISDMKHRMNVVFPSSPAYLALIQLIPFSTRKLSSDRSITNLPSFTVFTSLESPV